MVSEEHMEDEYRKVDEGIERPVSFDDFNGQVEAKENLKIYVTASRKLNKALDHVLFHGLLGWGRLRFLRSLQKS